VTITAPLAGDALALSLRHGDGLAKAVHMKCRIKVM